jgi:hypothetical protein
MKAAMKSYPYDYYGYHGERMKLLFRDASDLQPFMASALLRLHSWRFIACFVLC